MLLRNAPREDFQIFYILVGALTSYDVPAGTHKVTFRQSLALCDAYKKHESYTYMLCEAY